MRKRAEIATVAKIHLIKPRKSFESFLFEFSCMGGARLPISSLKSMSLISASPHRCELAYKSYFSGCTQSQKGWPGADPDQPWPPIVVKSGLPHQLRLTKQLWPWDLTGRAIGNLGSNSYNTTSNSYNTTNSNINVWNNYTIAGGWSQLLTRISLLKPGLGRRGIQEGRVKNIGE